ncbi:50S ribosomal protein L21, mitochondrial [Vitis vinifera]|uniref:Large ribosomal subunit protein bL21m n=1 Tax=Vitis vinifera TaxID=29760 RepID=A0A438IGG6_VITVI|nr:50S ribosomal protein L21, mitochondrial [Vitis vinifera]
MGKKFRKENTMLGCLGIQAGNQNAKWLRLLLNPIPPTTTTIVIPQNRKPPAPPHPSPPLKTFSHSPHPTTTWPPHPRHFSSHSGDDEDEDEEEDDDEEMGESSDSEKVSASNRVYSAEDKERESAAIGYKVVGPLQPSDRVFKPYEPVFAVVQIGSHQFKVSNGDCIYTERLKFCEVNDRLILNRVLLIGSTSQTIVGRPTLPDVAVHAVVEEHEKVISRFLLHKKKGGLGIRDLTILNRALLCKWSWRFAVERDSYWKLIIGTKFGVGSGGWCTCGGREGYGVGLWKEISKEGLLLLNNVSYSVGDGKRVRFWKDNWCGNTPLCEAYPSLFDLAVSKDAKVADCWDSMGEVGGWNPRFLRPFNDWEVEEVESFLLIIQGKRLNADLEDRMVWKETKDGIFSVKSCFNSLDHSSAVPFPWRIIWSSFVPSKVGFFAWEASWGRCSLKTN